MPNPSAAILVIGDEILSGRTRDANMHHLAQELTRVGIDLKEARVIGDDHAGIVTALRDLSPRYDHVFTSGGIGPTHDDITADAVAEAMEVNIGHRSDVMALLQAYYDKHDLPFNEARQRMARIPAEATLIDNPVTAAPGFAIGNVLVMAGVPEIFRAMVEVALPHLEHGQEVLSRTLRVSRSEGEVAAAFGCLADEFPELTMGSYPFMEPAPGTNLVLRGTDKEALDQAMARLTALFG